MYYLDVGRSREVESISGIFTNLNDLKKSLYDDTKYTIYKYDDDNGCNLWACGRKGHQILNKIIEEMYPNWHTDVSKILEQRLPIDIINIIVQMYIGTYGYAY